MAGLHPNPSQVAGQVISNRAQHTADSVTNLAQAHQALNPMPPQPPEAPQAPQQSQPAIASTPQGPNEIHMKLAQQLKRLGLSDSAVAKAIQMLNAGATPQQALEGAKSA